MAKKGDLLTTGGLWRALSRGETLFLIAGPCVIESEKHPHFVAERLKDITARLGIPFVFKASYDKANRSSLGSYRGPGLERGLEILGEVRARHGVPVLTDVHEAAQVEKAAAVADVLQIPAFLCRQTDLVLEAARTGKIVNIKKGQFMAPWDMKGVLREGGLHGQPPHHGHRAGHELRLQQPRGGHALLPDAAALRLPGDLRRDPLRAATRGPRRPLGRRRPLHRHPRPGGSGGRSRRALHGGPREPGARTLRRSQRLPSGPSREAAAPALLRIAGGGAALKGTLRPVFLAGLIVLGLSLMPWAIATAYPPAGTAFLGTFYYVDDFYNYLSYAQQAEDGAFLFTNKALLADHAPALVNLEWWLVGG